MLEIIGYLLAWLILAVAYLFERFWIYLLPPIISLSIIYSNINAYITTDMVIKSYFYISFALVFYILMIRIGRHFNRSISSSKYYRPSYAKRADKMEDLLESIRHKWNQMNQEKASRIS